MALIHIFHHDVECLVRMLGSPLPPLLAGLGKLLSLLLVSHVVVARHVNAILLHIIAVIAETIHALIADLQSGLYQLVILVIAHGQRGVERTREKQVDVLSKPHPLIVQMILLTHTDGQLSEPNAPDAHLGTLLRQRVLAACRYDDHRIVHRCLQNIHQGRSALNVFQCLT